jgi:chromate transport protein ChrA
MNTPGPTGASTGLPPVLTVRGLLRAFGAITLYAGFLAGGVALLVALARLFRLEVDTVAGTALGLASIVAGLMHLQPSWRQARPPNALPSGLSAAIYLAVGIALITVGITHTLRLRAATVECRELLARAVTSHERLAVLRRSPSHLIPGFVNPVHPFTCGGVLERSGFPAAG